MRNIIIGAAVFALGGAAAELPASTLETVAAQVIVQRCTRVEGSALGTLPLEVEVLGKTVRFAEWTVADERSTEVVGFAAQLPADVIFTVEAGDETFTGTAPRWLHPRGVAGPRVHGIDALIFCAQVKPAALAAR